MRAVTLREPLLSDEQEYLAFLSDMGNEEDIVPWAATLDGMSYPEFINTLELKKQGKYKPDIRVPDVLYVLVDRKNHIIGALNLRLKLNHYLSAYGGHIGYGIRPSFRRKGYGTEMLRLALFKCEDYGLSRILITCDESNKGSEKVILNNRGIFENKVYKHDDYVLRYWIYLSDPIPHKKLVIVTGGLACYKSTVARHISKTLHIPSLIKDEIKETLYDSLADQQVSSASLSKATMDLMVAQIPPLLQAYPKLVIEANFKAHELHAVIELAEKMRLYLVLLYLNGSYIQAYERYKSRDRDRHIAHKSHGDISYESFVHIQQSFIVNESKPLDINVDQFDDKHLKDITTLVERLLALE